MVLAAHGLGALLSDVVLTRDEISGLTAGLLVSDDPPLGELAFSAWLDEHADEIGRRYANELDAPLRRRLSAGGAIRVVSGIRLVVFAHEAVESDQRGPSRRGSPGPRAALPSPRAGEARIRDVSGY